jgi:hypothetical protein
MSKSTTSLGLLIFFLICSNSAVAAGQKAITFISLPILNNLLRPWFSGVFYRSIENRRMPTDRLFKFSIQVLCSLRHYYFSLLEKIDNRL